MNRIQEIQGKHFLGIYRAVDMLMLELGQERPYFDPDLQEESRVPEYSIHFMTQWRFVKDDAILLASRDIYIPYDPEMDEDTWEYDLTGRPDAQSSVFDVVGRELAGKLQGTSVESCAVNALGDLKLVFSDGTAFESFTPSCRRDEFWRMVHYAANGETDHLVVFE